MTGDRTPGILHVVRPAAGGIRTHVMGLMRAMQSSGCPVRLAAPRDFLDHLPTDIRLDASFELAIGSRFHPVADGLCARRLSRFDLPAGTIVHAHGMRASFIAAVAQGMNALPFVCTLHNLLPTGTLQQFAIRYFSHKADGVICVSQVIADGLVSLGVESGKIAVIPNGIDLNHFACRSDAGADLWDIPPADFLVGSIARLSPEKGVDILLQAAAETPTIGYLIAGDGPDAAALKRVAPDNVRFLGRIADVRALLSRVDVLAMPSRMEGQGIAALEAMAHGVPIVASRVGGLAEMLVDRETAMLVEPGDAEHLSRAILELVSEESLRKSLAAAATDVVRQRYSLGVMVRRTEEVYGKAWLSPSRA